MIPLLNLLPDSLIFPVFPPAISSTSIFSDFTMQRRCTYMYAAVKIALRTPVSPPMRLAVFQVKDIRSFIALIKRTACNVYVLTTCSWKMRRITGLQPLSPLPSCDYWIIAPSQTDVPLLISFRFLLLLLSLLSKFLFNYFNILDFLKIKQTNKPQFLSFSIWY